MVIIWAWAFVEFTKYEEFCQAFYMNKLIQSLNPIRFQELWRVWFFALFPSFYAGRRQEISGIETKVIITDDSTSSVNVSTFVRFLWTEVPWGWLAHSGLCNRRRILSLGNVNLLLWAARALEETLVLYFKTVCHTKSMSRQLEQRAVSVLKDMWKHERHTENYLLPRDALSTAFMQWGKWDFLVPSRPIFCLPLMWLGMVELYSWCPLSLHKLLYFYIFRYHLPIPQFFWASNPHKCLWLFSLNCPTHFPTSCLICN
jgi:hypothetical protein